MTSEFAVVPMAIGMLLGPQILTAIFLATSSRPRVNSFTFVAAVALATTIGMVISYGTAVLFGVATDNSQSGDDWLTYILVGLLVVLSIRTFLQRHTSEAPAWMGKLQAAEPKLAFRLGLTLILAMPTDIIIMLSAGGYLVLNGYSLLDSWVFIATTAVLAAVPILAIIVVGPKADAAMPSVREWMTTNSWLVSIIVYVFFIYAFLS